MIVRFKASPKFKEQIFGRTLSALSTAELLVLHAQMQKLLEILLALQQELQAKEKNTTPHPYRSKDQTAPKNINGNVFVPFQGKNS